MQRSSEQIDLCSGVVISIRRLNEHDAEAYWGLRLAALQSDPSAFAESVEEHLAVPAAVLIERLRGASDDAFILGAFADGMLVATAGFMRYRRAKLRHKARIWGVFVAVARRRHGIGRALLAELLRQVRSVEHLEQVTLAVAATQQPAIALYRSLGFITFGREPSALYVDCYHVDEELMLLRWR